MASTRVNFSVGLFMTAGLALATLAIIWLGMSSFLRKGTIFVTYFDESVQGLVIDSPVKYRGVPVGRVQAIRIAPDYQLIEVVIQIEDEHAHTANRFADTVASLANAGITGAMFVEIDKLTPSTGNMSPNLSFAPEYPVIASKPSDIRKLFREVSDIAIKIQTVDFKGISDQAMAAFQALNTSIEAAHIGAIAADIRTLLASLNAAAEPKRLDSITKNAERTVQAAHTLVSNATADINRVGALLGQFESILVANRPHVDTTLNSLASTMLKADTFMTQSTSAMLRTQSSIQELQERMSATADNLEQTSANLDALISNLKDHPSQLFFGQPKKPRPVEE